MQRSQSSFAFKCKSNALNYARRGGPNFPIKTSENAKFLKSNTLLLAIFGTFLDKSVPKPEMFDKRGRGE